MSNRTDCEPAGEGDAHHSNDLDIERGWFLLAKVDPCQFVYFYEKYYDLIHKFIYRNVLDADLADDLTSETFLKAQRGLWKFRWMNVTFGAWLLRIALNEVRQHFRKLGSAQRALASQDCRWHEAPVNPLAQIVLSEDRRLLYDLVMGLDALSREIFQLHYWGDFTTRQVSVILNIPEGTVKTRLSRGREDIRRSLRGRSLGMAGANGELPRQIPLEDADREGRSWRKDRE